MTFLQWNCRGLRANFSDLQQILSDHTPSVLCLQETKLSPGTGFNVRNYKVFRKDVFSSTVAHGGVMVAVHSATPCYPVPLIRGQKNVFCSPARAISTPGKKNLPQALLPGAQAKVLLRNTTPISYQHGKYFTGHRQEVIQQIMNNTCA